VLHFQGLRWYQRLRERAGMMGQHGGNQDDCFIPSTSTSMCRRIIYCAVSIVRDMNEKPFPGVQGFAGGGHQA